MRNRKYLQVHITAVTRFCHFVPRVYVGHICEKLQNLWLQGFSFFDTLVTRV